MKRFVIAAIFLSGPTAFAQTPPPPSPEMLAGSWSCERQKREAGEGDYKTRPTYSPDGKLALEFSVTGGMHGMSLEFTGTATGDWKLQPDGLLTENIASSAFTSAKVGGQVMDPAQAKATFGDNLFGADATSMVRLTPTTLDRVSLVARTIMRCTRLPKS